MMTASNKHQYAEAVLSGAMTKSLAFTTYINDSHYNPPQGAYRLEQTQVMRNIMATVRVELALMQSVRTKQLQVAEQALVQLSDLLANSAGASVSEKLAILRLTKNMPQIIDNLELIVSSTVASAESNSSTIQLDKTLAVLEN